MSLRRKVLSNSIYQLVGKALTTITSLFLVAVITRSLGVGGYGNYITVLAYTQFFALFADLGVNLYLIKRLAAHPLGDEEVEGMFSLRILTTIGVLGLGSLGVLLTPYAHEVRIAILLGMGAVAAQTVNSLGVSILQAKLHMLPSAISEVVGRLVTLGLSLLAIALGAGLYGVVTAVLIGALANLLLTFQASNRYQPAVLRWNPAVWRRILRASLPISLTAILSYLYFKSDTVLLSILHLSGGRINKEEVGIYGAAYKVLEMLLLVPAIFIGNIFPILSKFWADQDERLHRVLQQVFDLMATFGGAVTVTVAVLASPIILFIAGPQFGAAAVPLRILTLTIFLTYFTSIYTFTALALNQQRRLALVYAWATAFNLLANLLFIPRYSYLAAAWVTFATEVIVLIGSFLICRWTLQLRLQVGILGWLIPIALVTGYILDRIRSLPVLLACGIGLLTYVFLVIALRVIRLGDISEALSRPA